MLNIVLVPFFLLPRDLNFIIVLVRFFENGTFEILIFKNIRKITWFWCHRQLEVLEILSIHYIILYSVIYCYIERWRWTLIFLPKSIVFNGFMSSGYIKNQTQLLLQSRTTTIKKKNKNCQTVIIGIISWTLSLLLCQSRSIDNIRIRIFPF